FPNVEVWVTEGNYNEPRDSVRTVFGAGTATPIAANTGSLILRDGVRLYGGFSGTEQARSDRDFVNHPTIIDGSTARGGQPAWNVVVAAEGTHLDGFIIRGGRASNDPVLGAQHLGAH